MRNTITKNKVCFRTLSRTLFILHAEHTLPRASSIAKQLSTFLRAAHPRGAFCLIGNPEEFPIKQKGGTLTTSS